MEEDGSFVAPRKTHVAWFPQWRLVEVANKQNNSTRDLKHFQEKRSQKTEFSINKQPVLKEGEKKTFAFGL